MSWQYCDCGRGLNPTPKDFLIGEMTCECGRDNPIAYAENEAKDVIIGMYDDIEELKQKIENLSKRVKR